MTPMSRTDLPNDARSKTNRGRVANALRLDEPSSQRPAHDRLERRRRGRGTVIPILAFLLLELRPWSHGWDDQMNVVGTSLSGS